MSLARRRHCPRVANKGSPKLSRCTPEQCIPQAVLRQCLPSPDLSYNRCVGASLGSAVQLETASRTARRCDIYALTRQSPSPSDTMCVCTSIHSSDGSKTAGKVQPTVYRHAVTTLQINVEENLTFLI